MCVILSSSKVVNEKSVLVKRLVDGLVENQRKVSDLFSKTETAEQRLLLLNEYNEEVWRLLFNDFGITSG